jgi:ABC-type sugar transport system substrate-binding protein
MKARRPARESADRRALITATPDLNVIFAWHDGTAAAVAAAVKQKGLTEDHGTCQ